MDAGEHPADGAGGDQRTTNSGWAAFAGQSWCQSVARRYRSGEGCVELSERRATSDGGPRFIPGPAHEKASGGAIMFRVSVREMFWLCTVGALVVGWLVDSRSKTAEDEFLRIQMMELRLQEASDLVTRLERIAKDETAVEAKLGE